MAVQPDLQSLASEQGVMLLIDKPLDWTSFDVVKRIRWSFQLSKVGHAGTLDPRATGLLIVCTGKQTKNIDTFVGLEKEYVGELQLGIQTPSFDLETDIESRHPFEHVTESDLRTAAKRFVGVQLQEPPMFSAVKHRGKPLYKYARRGKSVRRERKEIEVKEFEIVDYRPPVASFRMVCSKGTYVRSIVHDLGLSLGCGAVLSSLRRTRIGPYSVDQAMTIEMLENAGVNLSARTT
jgi:tRNA pseudouridine55 synthase